MKRLIMMAAVVPLSVVLVPVAASAVPGGSGTVCSAVPVSAPPGAKVETVTAVAHAAGTVTFPDTPPLPTPPPIEDVPAWCDITVTLTHPGANDHVKVKISLPQDPKQWTSRFQAVGGGRVPRR